MTPHLIPPRSEQLTPGHWFAIGIFTGPSPVGLAPAPGLHNPVLTYRDITDVPTIFVADPFLLREGNLWYMFFEVMNERTYKGEIALALSHDSRAWTYQGRVLVEPFSLSFPYVFRWEDQVYMLPDGYQQERLQLYRAESFPRGWRPVATVLQHDVADASIFRHDNRWWLIACTNPRRNDELRLYRADDLTGPWHEHPQSPIVTDNPHSARPAGRVLPWGQSLVRYTQDCALRYGSRVRAFEVTHLTPTVYAERAIAAPPLQDAAPGAWNSAAMHHVDAHCLEDGQWLACVDGHDHPSYLTCNDVGA
jgi:hypothetical protein